MKLRLIATIQNFTIQDLFKAFPRLESVVEQFKKLPRRQRDDEYKYFSDTVSRMVGWDSQQDKFDPSRAYQIVIHYAMK